MTTRTFEVRKDDLARTRWTDDPQGLRDGQVRVRVQTCALTANNVTYAVMGDRFGYWSYYPARDGWGRVPVWGYGEVRESCREDVEPGERLYGYWPMGQVATLTPGKVTPGRIAEGSAHRAGLPPIYNEYLRLGRGAPDPAEAHRALFLPLAGTSYGLADWLDRQAWMSAGRVICTSASSKTAIGTGLLIRERAGAPRVLGLTSARNEAVTRRVGAYDEVTTYDALEDIDPSVPTVVIDMAGDGALSGRLHQHLGERLIHNAVVGAAHPDAARRAPGMNDERTELFFMPGYAAERNAATDGRFGRDLMAAASRVADRARDWMRLVEAGDEAGVADLWDRVRRGALAPDEGGVLRMDRIGA